MHKYIYKHHRRRLLCLSAIVTMVAGHLALAERLPVTEVQLETHGHAQYSLNDDTISLSFDNPFDDPSLRINPPAKETAWDLSKWKYLAVDVENVSKSSQLRLLMEVSAIGDDQKIKGYNAGIGVNPGEKRTLRFKLPHAWMAPPQSLPGIKTFHTDKITHLKFFMQWPFESAGKGLLNCSLSSLRVEEEVIEKPRITKEQYIPFIDEYGQFMHDDWPAKIHSASDLIDQRKKELAELETSKRPSSWNKYGGWKDGPQREATGNFRTEKYNGKWYLVDPDGRLFWSSGINVISEFNDPIKVMPGHENWFKTLPDGAESYQPTKLALQQKYGKPDYTEDYFNTLGKRLEHWGINTIGDWSSEEIMLQGTTPYTVQLSEYYGNRPRFPNKDLKFFDVFDPTYVEKTKNLVSDQAKVSPTIKKSLTDPMCIGYWIDNELNFGNRGKIDLVDEVMKCPPEQASKIEFSNDLKAKYGTVDKLNLAWGASYRDWDDFRLSKKVPSGKKYRADAKVFFKKSLDQYFRLSREAVKSVAPHRLYLGVRFISTDAVRPDLYEMSKKYCDVLSVNIYAHSAANFPVGNFPDMPVLIGEFHFGVLDRGMFSPAICAGVDQRDRALAYMRFMQGALVHPNIVGAHWFQYRDQPLTGRGDGEAYPIGFVDVADTPYQELVEAARNVGENMYTYRAAGKLIDSMEQRAIEETK